MERLYRENLPLIEALVAFVCRKSRFSPEVSEDFQQQVHLKLIDNDYRILRECAGKNLGSYLKVVILRAGQDYRNHLWGKYRDSTEAKRLGTIAVKLERLINRDGLSYEEARQILRINEKVGLSDEEFDALWVRLPPRVRKQMVPMEPLFSVPTPSPNPEDDLHTEEAFQRLTEILTRLKELMAELPSEQQLLLKLNIEERMSLADIARSQGIHQKPLYGLRDRALRWLRERLEEGGIKKEELEGIFRLLLDFDGMEGPE